LDRAEFDRFADEYQAQHATNIAITGERPEYFAEYKIAETRSIVDALGARSGHIVDFGAGIGSSVPFFRKYFAASRVTCADPSARSLDLARARFPGDESYLLVDRSVPVEAESFDLAFSACVFHHIPHEEHRHWLCELHRITKPDGTLVVFEHNPWNPLTVRAVNTCPFDENARLVRARSLASRIRAAGWSDPTIRYHVFFPRALAALRRFERSISRLPLGGQYSISARKT
jgi:SAM-dependent methyltransferase